MVEVARKYLERLGVINTQFAIVKHTDRAHPHLHIVANMVDNRGRAISDSWIGLRGKKVAQALTQEYHLVPAIRKDLALTHTEAMNEQEAIKYKIYQSITENLPHCRTMEDLEKRLTSQGIEVQYKYKGQTQERQGVSFKIGNACFKGSQIDRKYSLAGLQKTLEQQQQEQTILETNQRKDQSSPRFKKQRKSIPKPGESQMPHHSPRQDADKGHRSSLLEVLMRPEEDDNSLPYELSQEAEVRRRQRKHKRSR
jgi:hypothetical protein